MFGTAGEAWTEEIGVSVRLDSITGISDLIETKISYQTEPAIDVAGNRWVKPLPIRVFLYTSDVGIETYERIAQVQIDFRIRFITAGRCSFGFGRGLGLR